VRPSHRAQGGRKNRRRFESQRDLCLPPRAGARAGTEGSRTARRAVQSELKNYQTDAKAAGKMAGSDSGDTLDKPDAAELAAWTVVANVLLNLDETITKG